MGAVPNSYPELPEVPKVRTPIAMSTVIDFARTLIGKYKAQYIWSAMAIFRNESGNGQSGWNFNYSGIQGDCGRWKNFPGQPIGTFVKVDSGGKLRRFLAFDQATGLKVCLEGVVIKCTERNIVTVEDYLKKWVGRKPGFDIPTPAERQSWESMVKQAAQKIT